MRRKQAQAELELDPLVNFSAQLGGTDLKQTELNVFGEPLIRLRPRL